MYRAVFIGKPAPGNAFVPLATVSLMKKILLAFIGCALGLSSFAQKYEYGDPVEVKTQSGGVLRFGVFIAPTMTWMKPTSGKSDDKLYLVNSEGSKAGFNWGLMADYFFSENYGISTGFKVNNCGGRITSTLNPNATPPVMTNLVKEAYFDYKLQYLELPFGIKLLSDQLPGGFRLFGDIGVAVSINVGKKADYEVTYTDVNTSGVTTDYTVSSEKEKIQGTGITPVLLNLNVGGGIEYALTSKLSLYTGIFFNNGFAPDVTNPKEYDLDYKGKFDDATNRLNNVALRIGLFF